MEDNTIFRSTPIKPYYFVKEYKRRWLVIKMPQDKLIKSFDRSSDADFAKDLLNQILDLEAEIADLKNR